MRGFYAAAWQRLFAHCATSMRPSAVAGERPGGWSLSVTINGAAPRSRRTPRERAALDARGPVGQPAWPGRPSALAQVPTGASVLVLPFDNPRQEPRLAWMREGAAVLLTDLLAASGERVIDREERLRAFDRLQLPATAGLSRASSIKVGQAVGGRRRGDWRPRAQRRSARGARPRRAARYRPAAAGGAGVGPVERPVRDLQPLRASGARRQRRRRRPCRPIGCRPRRRSSSSTSRAWSPRLLPPRSRFSSRHSRRRRSSIRRAWRSGICTPRRRSTSARWTR